MNSDNQKNSNKPLKVFDFIAFAPYAIALSLLMVMGTIYVWIERGPTKYGIDYVGGYEYVVRVEKSVTSEQLRQALTSSQSGEMFVGAIIQSFDSGGEFSIRFSSLENSTAVRASVEAALAPYLKNGGEILRSDFVGPTIGSEMRSKALWALILGLIGITVYVTYRFEFAFALGALVALFHDVVISTGIYLYCGFELNGAALAAALAIIGYSVNDTIVIFDRVREEIFKGTDDNFRSLLNTANSACLSRTLITGSLTLASALALMVLGGPAIRDLSTYLVVGSIVGCYSTVFIACPIVLIWDRFREGRLRAKKALA